MIWFFLSVLFASNAMLWWRVSYLERVVVKLAEFEIFYATTGGTGGTGKMEFEQIWRPGK